MLSVVPKVAELKGVRESGFRTVMNTGPDSAATVKHFHIHILGGVKMGRFTFENSQRVEGLCPQLQCIGFDRRAPLAEKAGGASALLGHLGT